MELTLRKVEKTDSEFFVKELNSSKLFHQYIHTPYPYTKKDATAWINKCQDAYKKKKPTRYSYIITLDNVAVGAISFNVIDYNNNNAELGYWLSKKHHGKGIMSAAIKMICDISFNQLKLKRLYVKIDAKNKSSQNVLLRNKFKLEGHFVKDSKSNDKYTDTLQYALINNHSK